MNQFLRLGFRILGKACLKQMGTVSSFFFFLLNTYKAFDSTKEVGLNSTLWLSRAWWFGPANLQVGGVNNGVSGCDNLQMAAMEVFMLGPRAKFPQGSLCSELMTKYPDIANAT